MKNIITIALGLTILISGCKKPAGEGGQATIKGKILLEIYSGNFTGDPLATTVAQGEQVYIIYGDETSVGDNVRTSYDGTYEFKHLRVGSYKVYAISKDSTLSPTKKTFKTTTEVLHTVEIKDKKEVVTVPNITVIDN